MEMNDFYPDYKKKETEKEIEYIYETSWPKIIFSCFIGMVIMGVAGYTVASLGLTPVLMTDQVCNDLHFDSINQSFINGTIVGIDAVLFTLTNETVHCNTIPIGYREINYTLVAVECLDLTKLQEDINNE